MHSGRDGEGKEVEEATGEDETADVQMTHYSMHAIKPKKMIPP